MSWLKNAVTSPLVVGCSATMSTCYLFMALAPETASLCLPLVFANAFIGHFFIWCVNQAFETCTVRLTCGPGNPSNGWHGLC